MQMKSSFNFLILMRGWDRTGSECTTDWLGHLSTMKTTTSLFPWVRKRRVFLIRQEDQPINPQKSRDLPFIKKQKLKLDFLYMFKPDSILKAHTHILTLSEPVWKKTLLKKERKGKKAQQGATRNSREDSAQLPSPACSS